MEKLELKLEHVTPYLPYELPVWDNYENKKTYLRGFVENHTEPIKISTKVQHMSVGRTFEEIKPILRPLSDLTEAYNEHHNFIREILIRYGYDFPDDGGIHYSDLKRDLSHVSRGIYHPLKQDYLIVETMISFHFDIFGLIQKGLAIDKNTITT